MTRLFIGLIAVVVGWLLVSRAVEGKPPPAAQVSARAVPAPAPVRSQPVAPAPVPTPTVVAGGETRTPTIDRLVRIEARRRLAQSASYTYIDSLMTASDSTVRRWADREGRSLTVAIILPDQPAASRLEPRILAAAKQWEALGLGVRFVESTDTTGADVVVRWIDRFEGDRTGQADVQSGPDGAIQSARMTLALRDGANRVLTDSEIEMIATHEFGHVLGLPHSGNRNDIMFPVAMVPRLSDRDRATATLLYALPPGSLKEPAS